MKISTTQTMGMFIQSISVSIYGKIIISTKVDDNTIFVTCLLQRIVKPGMQA